LRAVYKVIDEFEDTRYNDLKIPNRILKCVKLFKKGDVFEPKIFAESHLSQLSTNGRPSKRGTQMTVTEAIKLGREIGLLQRVEHTPVSFDDFLTQETVSYFASQLRGGKLKNFKSDQNKPQSTKQSYIRNLWYFNNWLHGKTFEFSQVKQVDLDTFKKERYSVKLEGIEHFLKLYEDSNHSDSDFIKVIKRYLTDGQNQKYSSKYMASKFCAIMSYFEKNDCPLKFHYDPKVNHHDTSEENDNAILSLSDIVKMLSEANSLEKAVLMCKLHRGLDSTTMADRFNFQVWEQLVKWFGHNDYENWDLSRCPVPIRVTRVKTDYNHTGFLERDAIVSIQEYLNYRYEKYLSHCRKLRLDDGYVKSKNEMMKSGEPLFMKKGNEPITINWLHRLVPRLARKCGIQNKINTTGVRVKYEKTSHELRDLLKSTLIASGCADYVCDLAIGHKVKDTYEKQDKLYPEKSRSEYAKASKRLNILSKIESILTDDELNTDLKERIAQNELKIKELENKPRGVAHLIHENTINPQMKLIESMQEKLVEMAQEIQELKRRKED